MDRREACSQERALDEMKVVAPGSGLIRQGSSSPAEDQNRGIHPTFSASRSSMVMQYQ